MRRRRTVYLIIAAVVLVADLATKWIVEREVHLHDTISVVPGVFSLTHVQNRGAAFGIFDGDHGPWKTILLVAFSLIVLTVVVVLFWKTINERGTTPLALALILGGALGNLYDRVIAGHVTDFLLLYYRTYHWPAFNLADMAIVAGAVMLMFEIVFAKEPVSAKS